MLVKRLGDKIRRPHLQRLQFGGSFRRQDDDRDLSEKFIVLHGLQYFETVHDRHHQVQKHNRQSFPMRPYGLESLFSVFGADGFISRLQQRSLQHVPVDLLVVNDQNQLGTLDLF